VNTQDYLALVKRRHNIESDYGLAKLMGVGRQNVSGWQLGKNTLSNKECYKVAVLIEVRPDLVIADIEAERAEKAGKVEDVAFWKGARDSLGKLVLALLAGAAITGPGDSRASNGAGSSSVEDQSIHCGAFGKRRRKRDDDDAGPRTSRWCPA